MCQGIPNTREKPVLRQFLIVAVISPGRGRFACLASTSLQNVHGPLTNSFPPRPNLIGPNVPRKPTTTGESKTMIKRTTLASAVTTLAISCILAAPVFGQTATAPYQLSVFAGGPSNGSTSPDSITVLGDHVFVGYGDGHDPAGIDGKNSEIIEYTMDGTIVHIYSVPGHSDGLKVDPSTHLLWALQNEDANANLVVIDPETHHHKLYTFSSAAHGGGYDDIVFRGCKAYISASNPANNPNAGPAIVSAKLEGSTVELTPVLLGNANAIDIPTDTTV